MTTPQTTGRTGDGRGGRGGRLPRRRLTVADVTRVTPHLLRVRAEGDLAGWTADGPGSHLKVFVPSTDTGTAMRTYTVRRFDPDRGELTLEFGIHADGSATRWASAAAPGDTLEISGQARGGFVPRSGTSRVLLIGDHCALPAMASILESLPAGIRAEAVVEVTDPDDRIEVSGPAQPTVTWVTESGRPGGQLMTAVASMPYPQEPTEVWVGCEAGVMREIRRHLLAQGARTARSDSPSPGAVLLHTRAYWKLNTANHSDHDTGDDD
ncbi:siderophore-interacting protein [Streptomyces sp. NPDC046909]|uniref:siderophore-interacting protein n=1 Tax=Streptomyces sp. NPDC046909 TaxID=3155617 RepID=UPI0033FEFA59